MYTQFTLVGTQKCKGHMKIQGHFNCCLTDLISFIDVVITEWNVVPERGFM